MTTTNLVDDAGRSDSVMAAPSEQETSKTAGMLGYAAAGPTGSVPQRVATTLVIAVGAALVATTGAIHLHLWATGYRTIPTIGPLFLFQGIAGAAIAVALVVTRRLLIVVAAAGFMIATIGGFLLTVYVGLFGFTDTLAAPFAGVSLVVESVGAVILAAAAAVLLTGRLRSRPRTGPVDLDPDR